MMQRLTSKRLGHRASFRSLLMLGLVAGGACSLPGTVAAQSSDGLTGLPSLAGLPPLGELPSAPPSLHSIPDAGQSRLGAAAVPNTLPAIPAMLPATLGSSSLRARIAAPQQAAPRHVVGLLGLKPRGTAAGLRSTPLAMPSQFDTPVVPELKQVQFESSPRAAREGCVPASQTDTAAGAGVVTHAFLAQPGAPPLQGVGQAPVRPLSSAPVVDDTASVAGASTDVSSAGHGASNQSTVSAGAANRDEQEGDAPVVRGPVKYDPAFSDTASGGASDGAVAKPSANSESLLDVDLSALAIQGPAAGPVTGTTIGAAPAQAKSILVEDSTPKLIGTEPGSLSQSQPIARAPQLSLADASPMEERDHHAPMDPPMHRPVKAQLAVTTARPTRVKIHETFAPRPASPAQSFHLSDDQVAVSPTQVPEAPAAPKLAAEPKRVEETQPLDQASPTEALPAPTAVAAPAVVSAPTAMAAPTVVAAPALLPPAPLSQAPMLTQAPSLAAPTLNEAPTLAKASTPPEAPAASTPRTETSSLLPVPFDPGSEGLVVKASRPGLELPKSHKPESHQLDGDSGDAPQPDAPGAVASLAESHTPEIARSSAQRPISMRITAEAMDKSASSASTRDSEPRALIDHNPLAHTGPVVRAVKQMIPEPATKPAAATEPVTQATAVAPLSKQSKLALELMATIKKTFPSSRVELKPDEEEEGLVAEGVAASESEAKKILAMVRKTALCPVTDRIITTR